ncbi:hypothetical protein [Mycobacteroides abscessus]|uniref:hypothetical protein n=1 Tax=Mycobacteroides abscessus TaxID=36809 RepID=UPI00092637C3|nr:hypothetical protein [Mycobacteroides abscessus]SIJ34300.1 Uncharacterised protein [Mycobacteroides abscessus subsp. abscessus]SIK92799.1 Uncharacterised protein [Mycobacteroides abscessus subsp. abscessus]SIL98325.1 Uncharacterised protein [Mycobacteroides abscessus subsp. abscessus]SLE80370.1 Uncharacterised protein [Mycobacteroides abscessus subsp. abscessus]
MTVIHDNDAGLHTVNPKVNPARDATAFRRIVAAVEAVQEADSELVEAVRSARQVGDSWTAIAVALGTTRQAAQQRFSKLAD